jgi:uncharacterized repeat protein (TIGR03803 family)
MSEKPRAAQFLCIVNASRKMSWRKRTCTLFCAAFAATAMALPAQTFTTLHSFDGTDGENPRSRGAGSGNRRKLIRNGAGAAGPIAVARSLRSRRAAPSRRYTTFARKAAVRTANTRSRGWSRPLMATSTGQHPMAVAKGGANCAPDGGCGTIFKITPGGVLTTLYSFCAQSGCTDGISPIGTLVNATNGYFYGTTDEGGVSTCAGGGIKLWDCLQNHPEWRQADDAVQLCAQDYPQCTDGDMARRGAGPGHQRGLLRDNVLRRGQWLWGTVFKITPTGTLTTLHSFGVADGAHIPVSGAGPGHQWGVLRDNMSIGGITKAG